MDRTGILPNSPLICCLASVRFTPWSLLSTKIGEIHEELRDVLPLIQQVQMFPIGQTFQPQVENSTVSAFWMILSADRSRGIQVTADQILFFSKRYERYSEFSAVIEKVLAAFFKRMKFLHATTLGVRYVDHIKPLSGENADKYLHSALLPTKFDGLENLGGGNFTSYGVNSSELRIRCNTLPGTAVIPDDLLPLFQMAQLPGKALEVSQLQKEEILLDMDTISSYPIPERMESSSAILTKLGELHSIANNFFRRDDVCTDHAFITWRKAL